LLVRAMGEYRGTKGENSMAKARTTKSKATPAKATGGVDMKHTAKAIMEQAEQIWLAGLGAFSKAQEQSGKFYETLVKEGAALEKMTRKFTGSKVEEVRGMVENTVTQVRQRASDSWDRLEEVFENRVSKALGHLGIPGRDELETLAKRVDELAKAVRALDAGQRASKAPKAAKPAPVKAAQAKPARAKRAKAAPTKTAPAAAPAKPARAPRKPRAAKVETTQPIETSTSND
jgi:poly(hydroxyalkanoate) granule-associated protein